MKRFTKSLIALALLFAGTMGASAKTLNVDLSRLPASSENTTWAWNAGTSTGTFAWSNTSWNSTELFSSGNYSSYTTLNLETTAGTANHFRIILKYMDSENAEKQITINPVATGKVSLKLTDYTAVENLSSITTIRLSGANDGTGDITVSSIYLEGPDVVYMSEEEVFEAPEGTTGVNDIVYGTDEKWNISYPQVVANETLFGGDIDSDDKSININDYDYLHFIVSDASADAHTGLRVFVTDNDNNRQTLYPHPIENADTVTNWKNTNWITTSGTYVVKISDYPLLRGFKALQGWNHNAGKITVSDVYLSQDAPAAPDAKYIISGEEALTDATVTCFDVTALSGSGLTYNAANPNALFIANAGQLTNEKNVIVDGVCANLELTDGNPFQAPVAFTATSAKFTKTVENDYATMVIPFAAAVPSDVEAYEITGNNGDKLTTSLVESVAANKPVMLKGNGTFDFVAENAAIAATTNAAQNNGLLNGVYANTAVPTENTYVLQKQEEDVNFYKAISGLTVNPFRAYLTTAAAARLTFDFNEATGIKTVKTTEGTEVYNLQGVRVANPTKGLYIVNGKKVIK